MASAGEEDAPVLEVGEQQRGADSACGRAQDDQTWAHTRVLEPPDGHQDGEDRYGREPSPTPTMTLRHRDPPANALKKSALNEPITIAVGILTAGAASQLLIRIAPNSLRSTATQKIGSEKKRNAAKVIE